MHKQLEQAVDSLGNLNAEKNEQAKKILLSYAEGRIDLQEAYYELLDSDLIPMPSRCGMFAKPVITPEIEENLKRKIREKLS